MLITFNKICLVLTYNAEWCAANGEKKGEMGGGEERAVAGTFSLAAHLPPPVSSGGPHHSAANAVSKRNLLPAPPHAAGVQHPPAPALPSPAARWAATTAHNCEYFDFPHGLSLLYKKRYEAAELSGKEVSLRVEFKTRNISPINTGKLLISETVTKN